MTCNKIQISITIVPSELIFHVACSRPEHLSSWIEEHPLFPQVYLLAVLIGISPVKTNIHR